MTLITGIRQLLTLRGPSGPRKGEEMRSMGIIEDGAVTVQSGIITAVGRRKDLSTPGAEVVDLEGRVLMPGLIDAHTHAVFAGSRVDEFEMRLEGASYSEIAQAGGGIRSSMRAVRDATEENLLAKTLQHLTWMRDSGTVAAEVKSGYGLDLESELKMLRVARRAADILGMPISTTFLGAHAIPPEFAGDKNSYLLHVTHRMLPAVAAQDLANAVDMFVEVGYFDDEDARELSSAARSYGLRMRLHADQMQDANGAELASEIGAWTADHLEHTPASKFAKLLESGTIPVLLPASVSCLCHSVYPDARGMIDAGLPVVLATDFNPGSAPCPSLPWVMQVACTQMRLTPAEAIAACTVNASYAAGFDATLGTIETGKEARFTVLDSDDYREIAYYAGRSMTRVLEP